MAKRRPAPNSGKRAATKVPSSPEIVDEDEDEGTPTDPSKAGSEGFEADDIIDIPTVGSAPASSVSMPASVATMPVRSRRDGLTPSSALEMFMAQVGRFPVLSAEEEKELAVRVFEGHDPVAAKKLVVHNLRLVVKMAYKYRRAWASVLDLIQEGNIGLLEAVQRFDPFRGARFSTYATYWIRAYIIRYLLEHSRMVRISRTRAGRKLFFRLAKERERLNALGIEAGPKLLAERLGVSEEDYEEVAKHMDQSEVRLDAPVSQHVDGGATMLDMLSGEEASPESMAHRAAFSADVSVALDEFAKTLKDPREIAAWGEHLMSDDPISLAELGERFGVTKQRMGQIVNGIRKRLKEHLVSSLGPDVELEYRG